MRVVSSLLALGAVSSFVLILLFYLVCLHSHLLFLEHVDEYQ